MRRPHLGILAIVAASAAVDLIAAHSAHDDQAWPLECFLWGLALSQNSLLWTWAGLGQTRLVVRFTGAAIGTMAHVKLFVWARIGPGEDGLVFLLLFLPMALTTLLVSTPFRFRGVLINKVGDAVPPRRSVWLQFSLWNVMEATTAVAILAGLAKLVVPAVSLRTLVNAKLAVVLTLGLPFAALSLMMTWVLLRPRFSVPLLFLLGVAVWLVYLVVAFIVNEHGDGRSFQVAMSVAGLLFATLLACRFCGYRVGKWPAPETASPAPFEAALPSQP